MYPRCLDVHVLSSRVACVLRSLFSYFKRPFYVSARLGSFALSGVLFRSIYGHVIGVFPPFPPILALIFIAHEVHQSMLIITINSLLVHSDTRDKGTARKR